MPDYATVRKKLYGHPEPRDIYIGRDPEYIRKKENAADAARYHAKRPHRQQSTWAYRIAMVLKDGPLQRPDFLKRIGGLNNKNIGSILIHAESNGLYLWESESGVLGALNANEWLEENARVAGE